MQNNRSWYWPTSAFISWHQPLAKKHNSHLMYWLSPLSLKSKIVFHIEMSGVWTCNGMWLILIDRDVDGGSENMVTIPERYTSIGTWLDCISIKASTVLYNTPIPLSLAFFWRIRRNDSGALTTIRHVAMLTYTQDIHWIILKIKNIYQEKYDSIYCVNDIRIICHIHFHFDNMIIGEIPRRRTSNVIVYIVLLNTSQHSIPRAGCSRLFVDR